MEKKIETICVQGGYTPKNGEPRQIPIYQSTTFKYDTSEDMGKLFDLEAAGYFYSRLLNPTCDYVAKKICDLRRHLQSFCGDNEADGYRLYIRLAGLLGGGAGGGVSA